MSVEISCATFLQKIDKTSGFGVETTETETRKKRRKKMERSIAEHNNFWYAIIFMVDAYYCTMLQKQMLESTQSHQSQFITQLKISCSALNNFFPFWHFIHILSLTFVVIFSSIFAFFFVQFRTKSENCSCFCTHVLVLMLTFQRSNRVRGRMGFFAVLLFSI